MEEENKTVLLIEIIVSLILALAFFSNYAIDCTIDQTNCPIRYIFMLIFLFGILAIAFLYLGHSLNQSFSLFIGYVFAGAFILAFGWLILTTMVYDGNYWNMLNPIKSTALWATIIISLIIVFLFRDQLIKKRHKNI